MRKRQKESECEIERGRKGEQSDDIQTEKTNKHRKTGRQTERLNRGPE